MRKGNYWDSAIEQLPAEDLRELQLERLKDLVRYVYKENAGHRKRFSDAGVKPQDIRKLEDISKLPFLTKDDLRHYYPYGLACVPMSEVLYVHASSGTTGKPVVAPYSKEDLENWSELMARSMWAGGFRRDDVLHNAYGYGLFTGAHGHELGANRIGAAVIPMGAGNTRRQLAIMQDFGATALGATPSYALNLAEVAKQIGLDPSRDFNINFGFLGAETWSNELRDKIESTWTMKACEQYGLTEVIGPGVSFSCGVANWLHVNADHFLMEVVDPQTGESLPPGERGELVFTTLQKEAFPVIRFRTKDLAVESSEICECGRTLPRHSRILGRADDMIKVKGVMLFPRQIEEAIMRVQGASENYQLVKFTEGSFQGLRVLVEPVPEVSDTGDVGKMIEAISREIYTMLSVHVEVKAAAPGSIPRSAGKAKRVTEE
ncbi:phenylacetate--CoA ligase family protein [Candidatus Bipolaricaulota bacterium]